MDIESELTEDFEDLPAEEKVKELEALKRQIDDSTDAGALKQRIVEELVREYSQ